MKQSPKTAQARLLACLVMVGLMVLSACVILATPSVLAALEPSGERIFEGTYCPTPEIQTFCPASSGISFCYSLTSDSSSGFRESLEKLHVFPVDLSRPSPCLYLRFEGRLSPVDLSAYGQGRLRQVEVLRLEQIHWVATSP